MSTLKYFAGNRIRISAGRPIGVSRSGPSLSTVQQVTRLKAGIRVLYTFTILWCSNKVFQIIPVLFSTLFTMDELHLIRKSVFIVCQSIWCFMLVQCWSQYGMYSVNFNYSAETIASSPIQVWFRFIRNVDLKKITEVSQTKCCTVRNHTFSFTSENHSNSAMSKMYSFWILI